MVGVVIVFHAAMVAIPVSGEELLSVVTRSDPVSAFIRRTRPITRVPAISAVYRVLITIDPDITGAGRGRTNRDDAWRRRGPNANADANLGAQSERATHQKQS
jgi:hypothetical protein